MGFTLGTYGATDATGWSTFSSPSIIVYVSNAGSDSSTTPDNINTPFLTINHACLWLRVNGYNGTNFWILLRKGDTFTNQHFGEGVADSFALYGPSADNPAVVGAYDPNFPGVVNPATGGARPIVVPENDYGMVVSAGNDSTDYLAIVGLNSTVPQHVHIVAAVQINAPFNFILVEDCYFNGYTNAFDYVNNARSGPCHLRRNVFTNCTANGIHSGCTPWYVDENIIVSNGNIATDQLHNIYTDSITFAGSLDPDFLKGDQNFRGNIFALGFGQSQIRGPGTLLDNCFIRDGGHNLGNPFVDERNVTVSNNVYTNGSKHGGSWSFEVFETMGMVYLANWFNLGTVTFTNNIIANSDETTGGHGISLSTGQSGYIINNNIFYNWCSASLNNSVGSNSTNIIQEFTNNGASPGTIKTLSLISGGTGYVDKYINVIGISSTRESASNNITLLVDDTTNLYKVVTPLWLTGLTDSGGNNLSTLNDTLLTGRVLDIGTPGSITINDSTDIINTTFAGSSPKLYYPYYGGCSLDNVTGSGSGASTMPIVVGTSVVALHHGADDRSAGQAYTNGGSGYVVGDHLTVANSHLGGSGSGLVINVDTLCANTIGSNVYDVEGTNANGYPHPEREAASYYASIGGTASVDDFITALLARDKRTSNFSALTANNGINPYIRAGFGILGTGGRIYRSIEIHGRSYRAA